MKLISRNTFLLWCVLLSGSCSAKTTPELVLIGSTPGDESIKSMFSIPASTNIDFIKWHLVLDSKESFILNIVYGESKPNTLGFKDGVPLTINGTFTVSESQEIFKQVYHLKSSSLTEKISLVKLNENLFHILTPENNLLVGNGGWSYTLNRKDLVDSGELMISSAISDNNSSQLVFDGRTPCQEIAAEHPEMNSSQSCFKLKWRLILNMDSVTNLPTTYTIRKVVDNKPRDISGTWTIINGTTTNPNAVIYQIDPDKPDESISFLVGDDNVLFFLDKNNQPYIGNQDFSFTLNKRI